MSMKQEMLEILIGKHLDGEITPSEQQILQKELERNPQAKELIKQLQDLHEHSCETIASEITGAGKEAGEIFEQAWRRQTQNPLRQKIRLDGRLRFAAGLAAGLAIGLILHFVLPLSSTLRSGPIPTHVVVQNTNNEIDAEEFDLPQLQMEPAGNAMRNVDWYSFTDNQGNQWLVEGLREGIVRPAAYYGDL